MVLLINLYMLLNWAGLATCAPSRLPALRLQALPLLLGLALSGAERRNVVHLAQRYRAPANPCRKEYRPNYLELLTLTALELEF